MGSRLFLQLSPVQSQAKTNTTKLATNVRSKPNNGKQAGKQAPEADGNQHRHHISTNFSFALQDSGWASVVRFTDTMASLTCPSSTFSLHGHTDASFALAAAAALLRTTTASMTSPRLALSSSHTHNGPGHSPLFRKRKRRTAHGARRSCRPPPIIIISWHQCARVAPPNLFGHSTVRGRPRCR